MSLEKGVSIGGFNRETETMISAGIDIGTSTTKLIISRFSLMNVAGTTHVPKIEIVDKEVLYKSPIFRTPLTNPSTINVVEIEKIVRSEYAKAGIVASKLQPVQSLLPVKRRPSKMPARCFTICRVKLVIS